MRASEDEGREEAEDQFRLPLLDGKMKGIPEKIKRTIFVAFGSFFLAIGAVGVLVPVLPTTPFLLLAAACYLRGSEKLHHWIMNNRVFGEFIRNYVEKRGVRLEHKIASIALLWAVIAFSIVYVFDSFLLRALLFLIATAVSIHVILLPSIDSSS